MDSRESSARIAVSISGIVQGVGYRPFIYRLATEEGLSGFVRNYGGGVYLEAQGDPAALETFLRRVRCEAPPAAAAFSLECESIPTEDGHGFEIRDSGERESAPLPVTPDLATCADCLAEIEDPHARRVDYPFTNCTNCGPRFTILTSVPYDRPNTTMCEFRMCESCAAEYGDPGDRRFHAEPIACPECGPRVKLIQPGRGSASGARAVRRAAELLGEGAILAVKGIGGYHLACDARREASVSRLRERKGRYDRPLALMARDSDVVRGACHLTDEELALLRNAAAPIVLLRRREGGSGVAPSVAPRLWRLGVMLPYTPLHHLLLQRGPDLLVMTSGNLSDEPIAFEDEDAAARLGVLVDATLANNRRIRTRCDDSVAWVAGDGRTQITRRSRGYVPLPLSLPVPTPRPVLAVGGHFKNTFCLAQGDHAYLSHHIGDTSNLEALDSLEDGIAHYMQLFSIDPMCVAFDMHPEYLTTKYAVGLADGLAVRESRGGPVEDAAGVLGERPARGPGEGLGEASGGGPVEGAGGSAPGGSTRPSVTQVRWPRAVAIQHHHAHVASCMAENGTAIGERVLGVAFDGTGYGPDGTIWGGEFLICAYDDYRRFAHFGYMPLPGGERAIVEPWRLGAFAAERLLGDDFHEWPLPIRELLDLESWRVLRRALEAGVNAPLCCSVGRLFDCVAAVLGIRGRVGYEGQAAVELETVAIDWIGGTDWCRGADPDSRGVAPASFPGGGGSARPKLGADIFRAGMDRLLEIDSYEVSLAGDTVAWEPIVRGVLDDALRGEPAGFISARFHRTVAEAVRRVAREAATHEGIETVALTGGSFVNTILHHLCTHTLSREGFTVLVHALVPPNDGGIAYGQAAVAAARLAAAGRGGGG